MNVSPSLIELATPLVATNSKRQILSLSFQVMTDLMFFFVFLTALATLVTLVRDINLHCHILLVLKFKNRFTKF